MSLALLDIITEITRTNTVVDFLSALAAFVVAFAAMEVIVRVIAYFLRRIKDHTRNQVDDLLLVMVESLNWPLFAFLAFSFSLQFLELPPVVNSLLRPLLIIVVTYYVIKALAVAIDFTIHGITRRRQEEDAEFDPTTLDLLGHIVKVALGIIAIILILSNLGYDVTTLIASLGIAGIAIAFALQNVLSDIFASFSIHFDKPFTVGDFIIIGQDMGTVKKIGMKSTRIEALQGQEIVVSNKELTETRVHNYKRMDKRRVVFPFGVVYGTSTEKLRQIPGMVRKIIDGVEGASTDRVHFLSFGDFSLNFEVVYYVDTSDYTRYMDIQQAINLGIKERFEGEGIDMAFPTQTILLSQGTGGPV